MKSCNRYGGCTDHSNASTVISPYKADNLLAGRFPLSVISTWHCNVLKASAAGFCHPQDSRGSVERICHFLGKELTGPQMDAVVENASFQTMRKNKMSNMSLASDTMMDHSQGVLLRKGKSATGTMLMRPALP